MNDPLLYCLNIYLTYLTPLFPSCRNRSTDLQYNLVDWLLYDRNFGPQWVHHSSYLWGHYIVGVTTQQIIKRCP